MAKIDWSKAAHRIGDPARTQQIDDFVERDVFVVTVVELTVEEQSERASRDQERRLRSIASAVKRRSARASPGSGHD